MTNYQSNFEKWLNSDKLTAAEKEIVRAMDQDEKQKKQYFSHGLSFGTAGLRGVLGAGTNRINKKTNASYFPI